MKCNFIKFCDCVSPEAFRCSMKIYSHRDFLAGGREATMILYGGLKRNIYAITSPPLEKINFGAWRVESELSNSEVIEIFQRDFNEILKRK